MGRLLQMLFGGLFMAIIGLFIGAAIVSIVYVVHNHITLQDIPKLIREALRSSTEKNAREMVAKTLNVVINSTEINTITLDALTDTGEKAHITLKGDSVAQDIQAGMKLRA